MQASTLLRCFLRRSNPLHRLTHPLHRIPIPRRPLPRVRLHKRRNPRELRRIRPGPTCCVVDSKRHTQKKLREASNSKAPARLKH